MTVRFLAAAAAIVLAACSSSSQLPDEQRPGPGDTSGTDAGTPTNPPANFDVAKSSMARAVAPSVPAADLAAAVQGNTAFALDLFRRVAQPGKNAMVSPFSIESALAMTWAGARGQTETEMATALRFTLPQARMHTALNGLELALTSRANVTCPPGENCADKTFRLRIANATWAQRGYPFEQGYLDTLAVSYGAGVNLLDFAGSPDPSRLIINEWVATQTEQKIKDLLAPGTVTPDTRLVLTNAIYFKASWATAFDEKLTADATFKLDGGQPITVPTMRSRDGEGRGVLSAEYDAVELPYFGNALSMVIIAPAAGTFAQFEAGLDSAKLDAVLASLKQTTLDVTLPRFKFEWKESLRTALEAMGMPIAFTARADFSGMSPTGSLAISDVIHQTFIGVDEKGTEAAAATAVVMVDTSVPPPPLTVRIDRPFLFAIRDRPTGQLLFVGRVLDPR